MSLNTVQIIVVGKCTNLVLFEGWLEYVLKEYKTIL